MTSRCLSTALCLALLGSMVEAVEPTHWSFVKPVRPDLPLTRSSADARNPIDLFVLDRLNRKGLVPSPEADRVTLIRRVTLDLTGLPPTPDQVDAFVRDRSPDAYERLVDRLLASPRFGERMALPWLDAARYADTHGYLFDTARSMWRWRDWVIRSFNRNQPFDRFTIEQLAGDLLPEPTLSQKIATGFNRNHLINNEAGANPQEYLVENIIDRVNTTSTVWMGLSFACCQCHDHKYDPFTQREYYRLYAFFNTIPEVGLDGLNSNAKPIIQAPTLLDKVEIARLRQAERSARQKLAASESQIASAQAQWEAGYDAGSPPTRKGLVGHWKLDKNSVNLASSGRPATHQAAPARYEPGILGHALRLNGLGYLNAAKSFPLSRHDHFTFAAWIRLTTRQGRMSIVSRMERAEKFFRGYTLQLFAGTPSLFLINKFPQSMIQVQAKSSLQPGKWYHIAATYDGSGKAAGVKLYLNGEPEKPSIRVSRLTEEITTNQDFLIGNGHPGAKFKGLIDDVRVYRRVLPVKEIRGLPGLSLASLLKTKLANRTREQRRRVREHFLKKHAEPKLRKLFRAAKKAQDELTKRQRALPTVMVMKRQKKPRVTRVLDRGAFDKPGEKVTVGTPQALPAFDARLPKNRLGLARWLVGRDHPLTARVTVNRFWQMYFGQGIVRTSDDFGLQGDPPSHPRLLDWLAVEFLASSWDVKAMQRLIVTSRTYRQSSRVTKRLRELDPDNRWLARGPSVRLPAELIRDQALFASGLMVNRIGGPSVKPYQPKGLWREVAFDFAGAALTAQIYKQDKGARLFRRSMYTFWKRTSPPPSMLLFDAPDRERCVVRRARTSTPLQALLLLNSPTFVESSRKLAERLMSECRGDERQKIQHGFRLILARKPTTAETEILYDLFDRRRKQFRSKPESARQLLKVGNLPAQSNLDQGELAAYTVVVSVVFNLHETINKR